MEDLWVNTHVNRTDQNAWQWTDYHFVRRERETQEERGRKIYETERNAIKLTFIALVFGV